jgi:hypothetical protein
MTLSSISDVQQFYIEISLPKVENNLVKIIMNDIPVGKLKLDSISERDDTLNEFLEIMPRYRISGKGLEVSLYENKIRCSIGSRPRPTPLDNLLGGKKYKKEELFNKEFLYKVSMDFNYLLGLFSNYFIEKRKDIKIKGYIVILKKDEELKTKNIINNDNLNKIYNGIKIIGISLDKYQENYKIELENFEKNLIIDVNYELDYGGTFDMYNIIEKCLAISNELMLSI